jgi:iron complex outermembrane receptor protein
MSRDLISRLLTGAGSWLMIVANSAHAGTAPPDSMTGAGSEGTDIEKVVVTAERNRGAAAAPSKGSLDETQPESIISRPFIDLATPETGDWTTVVAIAPSVSGITSNGGNIGEYNKVTMRGFQDGQFNITYDGISFGDTNDPTHHSASYWPASTIGAAVVDRGPGAAGDMGQANFGGAIHYFSPEVSNAFGLVQKLTGGSFATYGAVTTLNTGELSALGGGKLLLNLDERMSDGELSHSGGSEINQLVKFVLPLGQSWVMTVFGSREYTYFHQSDAGPGATWAQVQTYGKDFGLTTLFGDEHDALWNHEAKTSDFEYIDLKGGVTPTVTLENQLYTYYYQNKTISSNDITGLINVNTSPVNRPTGTQLATDIGGYDKLNQYRVFGDIFRLNKDFGFGLLKIGGLIEGSTTQRHNLLIDLNQDGSPDLKFTAAKYPLLLDAPTNAKLQEDSTWMQGQVFADFDWNVTESLRVSPGLKYVTLRRSVNASNENVAGATTKDQPLSGSNTYSKPLYFMTANYKIRPDWSVYGQAATSFLMPSLSFLYATGAQLQKLQPQTTVTYQVGTVYSHGAFTADVDVYRVNATNLAAACNLPNPTAGNPTGTVAGFCNFGKARYQGVEGEAAYAFEGGLSLFVNGSINKATQLAQPGDPADAIAGNPEQTLINSPASTLAAGARYTHGALLGSLTYKRSGSYVAGYHGTLAINLPGYDTMDAAVAYSFGKVKLKLQAFNLQNKRAITSFTGAALYSTADTGLYLFQAGREFEGTVAIQLY